MKKILWLLLVTGLFPSIAKAATKEELAINKTAQGINFNATFDSSGYERFSAQAIYADGTPSSATISDGQFSSATVVVNTFDALRGKRSSATIEIVNGKNTSGALTGAVITIQGKSYTEATDWTRGLTSTITAASIASAIDAHANYDATASSNIINITAYTTGTFSNGWTITVSTPAALSLNSATFFGGQDFGYININGTNLVEQTAWNSVTSSAVTAGNIAAAINANGTLGALITASTPTVGVVGMVSKTSGINPYIISVSSYTALTPRETPFIRGAASDISVTDDTFYKANHGFSTGLRVLFSTVSLANVAPTGLTNQTTYYAIRVDDNYFKVATSSMNAVAGTNVDITALTGGGTFGFNPPALTGSPSFKWQGSNDGTNFSDLGVSVATFTYTAAGNTLWDFASYAYKYLRVVFLGPTNGGLNLSLRIFGRADRN